MCFIETKISFSLIFTKQFVEQDPVLSEAFCEGLYALLACSGPMGPRASKQYTVI